MPDTMERLKAYLSEWKLVTEWWEQKNLSPKLLPPAVRLVMNDISSQSSSHLVSLKIFCTKIIHRAFDTWFIISQAYLFCGLLTLMPVVLSVLFSLRLCHKIERDSGTLFRLLTYLCALGGFYPQYLACRCFIICEVKALEVPMLSKKSEKLTQEPLQSLFY